MDKTDFIDIVKSITDEYIRMTGDNLSETVDYVSEQTRIKVSQLGGFRDITGKYRKSITFDRRGTDSLSMRSNIVYSRAPHYRLAHLLEHGHEKNSPAFPHWKPAEEFALALFESEVKKRLESVSN